ncbi:hypothetical protein [Stenotrophomonas sp.]|uniref:hypothetical protein n=1 Tax=Stenotrophomonas sp. TaxID=69392 RepID=UPI0028AE4A78|nr:hypothetical protein [Stenotrophomonas sp.]
MSLPKRTIEELSFIYGRQPEMLQGSIFVEGITDKTLLDSYIRMRGVSGKYVYCMDTIDFSSVDFGMLGLPSPSSRSSVIALRKVMDGAGVDVTRAKFLIDRDQEDMLTTRHLDGVDLTDAGALPVHLFDNRVEYNLAAIVARGNISYEVLKSSVANICADIYALRVVNGRSDYGIKFLSPITYIAGCSESGFCIDVRSYVERCILAGRCHCSISDVIDEFVAVRAELDGLNYPRYRFINDHDLWAVLKAILDCVTAPMKRSVEDVEALVLATFDAGELASHKLFSNIVS